MLYIQVFQGQNNSNVFDIIYHCITLSNTENNNENYDNSEIAEILSIYFASNFTSKNKSNVYNLPINSNLEVFITKKGGENLEWTDTRKI